MTSLPTGTVTFLFTNVEGSTKLLERDPGAMGRNLDRHYDLLRQAVEAHGGVVFETASDAVCAAFRRAADGVAAALEGQRALLAEPWGEPGPLRVRMGRHTGEVDLRPDWRYFGPPLFRVARLWPPGTAGCLRFWTDSRTLPSADARRTHRVHARRARSSALDGRSGARACAQATFILRVTSPSQRWRVRMRSPTRSCGKRAGHVSSLPVKPEFGLGLCCCCLGASKRRLNC